jgi:broad specificity phosphatase PhoE
MRKIMLIRHGEKHNHGSRAQGITTDGQPSRHELTVRGWQRAAALVGYFAPNGGLPGNSLIQTPRSIFASSATHDSPSKRAMHTVAPLAQMLAIAVDHRYAENQEDALVTAILSAPSPVLVAWHHGNLPNLVRKIAGEQIACRRHWPDDRFDVTWVLDQDGAAGDPWRFSQLAQCLLPGDSPDAF